MKILIALLVPWLTPLANGYIISFILWTCFYWMFFVLGLMAAGVGALVVHVIFIFMAIGQNRQHNLEKLVGTIGRNANR